MKKVLLYTILLFSILTISSNAVSASSEKTKKIVNEVGTIIKSDELSKLSLIGLNQVEIDYLTEIDLDRYMSLNVESSSVTKKFVETKTYLDGDEFIFVDTELTETEFNERVKLEKDKNSKSNTNVELGSDFVMVRSLEVVAVPAETTYKILTTTISYDSATYNTVRNYVHVKVSLEWKIIPKVRKEDLIAITHDSALWTIDKDSSGLPEFYGKQIYGWSEYDTVNCESTNDICPDSEQIITINYNNGSTNNYRNLTSTGITLMQNIKNDYIWGQGGEEFGSVVTSLYQTIEGGFHTIQSTVTSGVFWGAYRHRTDTLGSFILENVTLSITYSDIIKYATKWYRDDPSYDTTLYSTAEMDLLP